MTAVLTHLALAVRDLDASVGFYRRFCGMEIVADRGVGDDRVVWIAEPGRERELIFVLMVGKGRPAQDTLDYSHVGFALNSREAVDRIADQARAEGCLRWPATDEPYPVGYFCGLDDPDGNVVEFSFGQPLGPGA